MIKNNNLQLAKKSLKGLSIGDAFGDSFFGETDNVWEHIEQKTIPPTKWEFTDDTVMAIAVLKNLEQYTEIQQDILAKQFASNYKLDINRGYGGTAHKVLREISEGQNWREVSTQIFDGQGSMGNGAAMRIAPLGAYFYNHSNAVLVEQAKKSAVVTHAHHEAQVGAIAIALAAKLAIQQKENNVYLSANEFITTIYKQLEPSDTTSKIGKSLDIPKTYRIDTVTSILGNGTKLLAQDTVPFALWCAAHYLDNFEEALWRAVSGLGDRDTIGAMVGSIVILSAPEHTIPTTWLDLVEKVENSPFANVQ